MSSASRHLRSAVAAAALLVAAAPALRAEPTDGKHLARDARGALVCPPVTQTGTFRVEIKRDGGAPTFALLVLERAAGCLSALLVTDDGPTAVEITNATTASLSGVVRTGRRATTLELRFSAAGVTGEMAHKDRKWSVSGERTS